MANQPHEAGVPEDWTTRDKERARRLVSEAIKRGELTRPEACQRCGRAPGNRRDGVPMIQGHHHMGYDRPLDVEWLCPACHRRETPLALGARNGNVRLTEAMVVEIIARLAAGEKVLDLLPEYPASETQLRGIDRGEQWPHIPRPPRQRPDRPGALLSEQNVRDIRAGMFAGETYAAIGARFGVAKTTIKSVVRGESWIDL